MTDRNILIIKTSWSYVLSQPENPGSIFYEKLFEVAPCLKSMFQSDLEHQMVKLTDMITFMVTHLQNGPEIKQEIRALALRHAHYGVKPEHYKIAGDALIKTIELSSGLLWNEETRLAWLSLYNSWASEMIRTSYNEEQK